MKLNRIKRRSGQNLILELTPLIDVVFLLLIFFMVATTFEDINSSIKIDLPTSTLETTKVVNEVQVIVTENKEYYVSYKQNNKTERVKTTIGDLKKVLEDKLQNSMDKIVVISADKRVDHGTIVNVMTASKEAGALSLDIDTASVDK